MAVFLIQPVDFPAQLLDLRLGAAHGQQAMTSENVVDGQQQHCQPQNLERVAGPKRLRLLRYVLLSLLFSHSHPPAAAAKTHPRACSASRAESSGVALSV